MEFDTTNTPILRLPAPLQNIIITPPLYTDGETVIKLLSDPRVYMNLAGPPYPYGQKDWDEWFPFVDKISKDASTELQEVLKTRKEGGDGKNWTNGVPMTAIREVDPTTGEQTFIGNLDATRTNYIFHGIQADGGESKQNENDALEVGDPKIDWALGYFLSPSYSGRGIMSAAVGTLIKDFLVPFMNVHHMTVSYFDYNPASAKVLEKNGFVFDKVVPEFYDLPESKTGVKGKKVGVGFYTWTRSS